MVFPELSFTGYRLDLLKVSASWLMPDDERLGDVREVCRRTGITAVVGAAFVSALYTKEEEHRLGLHLGARAMDNRTFTLLANLGGRSPLGESCGLSGFWGPDGYPLKQAVGTRTEVVPCVLQRSGLEKYRRPTGNAAGETAI